MRPSSTCDVIRFVQWNLRRCRDVSGECSVNRVCDTLAALRPTVVSLNEIDVSTTPHLLRALSERLGLEHTSFFGHVRGSYGNALLSSEPLTEVSHVHLDGGTTVLSRDGTTKHRIARGMLGASVSLRGVEVLLGVTHLDHISEVERGKQLNHALRWFGAGGARQHLLLGDLNALGRADYTEGEWALHEAHNARLGWGPPANADAGGTLSTLRGAGFQDAYAVAAARTHDGGVSRAASWTAHVRAAGPRYRIDYVWSRPPVVGPRLVPRTAFVETQCGRASDHQPVVVDFELCS